MTFQSLPEVVGLLVGFEEYMSSDTNIELLPTWWLENVEGPLWLQQVLSFWAA